MARDDDQRHTAKPAAWGFRLGIAQYLGFAFAAVVILAVAANLITHKSEVLRTQFVRTTNDIQALINSGNSVFTALDQYHVAVSNALDAPAAVARSALKVKGAALQQQVDAQAGALFGANKTGAAELQQAVQSYRALADALLQRDARRRALVQAFTQDFDLLDQRLRNGLDQAWKIFGRVVARESLLAVMQALTELRQRSARVEMPGSMDAGAVQAIVDGEQSFAAAMQRYEKSLRRSQGEDWLAGAQEEFAALVKTRRALVAIKQDGVRQREALEQARAAIGELLLQQLDVIKRRTPTTSVTTQTTVTPPVHDGRILWVSAIVLTLVLLISAVTVYRVARPVRRLVSATRRLAQGEADVHVPRGGLRELDVLAVAFNDMAAQLGQARASVQSYQAQLEARVDERTRQLQHLAEHDPLTQLPNRRQLLSHIEAALNAARASSGGVALLFVDLDNFKTLNDSLGHDFGDGLLQAVSQRLTEAVGGGFCARWGGDEFTVVLDSVAGPEEARHKALDVVGAFDRPLAVGERDVAISVSVGVSVFPNHAGEAEELLRAADAALFRAKELGRRQAHLFSADLLEAASSRFALEQALRRAVKFGEFELFYQPEVSLDTLQPSAVEALLRWRQPDGTYVSPGEFLVVAEQTGLINELSDWVLRTAIRAAARWHQGPWPNARVAVNLSSRQLLDQQFVHHIENLLEQYKLPAECLEIELTENVMQTGPSTIAALRALREIGVSIALDDFGTGYSSLTSLEQLPLTRVKIDRALISSIDSSPRSAAIARSIIGLCHSLGLEVTAEGIERPAQLARLLADRGLHMQGYLLSPPLHSNDLIALLQSIPSRLQQVVLALPELPFDAESTGAHSLRRYRAALAKKTVAT